MKYIRTLNKVPLKRFIILLFRHGEAWHNVGIFDGTHDCYIKLTNLGVQQGHKLGEFLYYFYRNEGIDLRTARLWTSPFVRAVDTAQIVREYLPFPEMRQDFCLREKDFGVFQWAPYKDWHKIDLQAFEHFNRCEEAGARILAGVPLGESVAQLIDRTRVYPGTLARDRDYRGIDTAFVSSHGWTIRGIAFNLLHQDLDAIEKSTNPQNCAVRYILAEQEVRELIIDNRIRRIKSYKYRDMGYIYKG